VTCEAPHRSTLAFLRTLGDAPLHCHGITYVRRSRPACSPHSPRCVPVCRSWRPDVRELPPGDALMLASDGVWDLYQIDELAALLRQHLGDDMDVCVAGMMEEVGQEASRLFGPTADDRTLLVVSL